MWGIEVTLVVHVAHGSSGLPKGKWAADPNSITPTEFARRGHMDGQMPQGGYLGYLPPLSTKLYELEKDTRVSPLLRLKHHPSACKRMSSSWQWELGRREGESTQECGEEASGGS